MLISKALAEKLEYCFLKSHQAVLYKQAELNLPAHQSKAGTGAAFYLGKDSFLTQVIAWGFVVGMEDIAEQLAGIEEFYRHHQHPRIDIELSPLCGMDTVNLLTQKNYQVSEFTDVSVLALDDYINATPAVNAQIDIVEADGITRWANAVAIGFDLSSAVDQFSYYAQAEGIIPFQASVGDAIAAGGTVAVHGKLCDLGVTSTLPGFRGQGLQKALLNSRLQYAKEAGAKFALVATAPGSVSDLNVQKLGFRCAYTRIKFSKELQHTN